MAYVQSILTPDPLYLDPKTYDARADRKSLADVLSPGTVGGSFLVSLTTLLGIQIAPGQAFVLGGNIADQGMYRQYFPIAVNLSCTTAHATLPRLDQVIVRVLDNAADASTFNEGRIEIVPGTPTAGATLANRNGAANLNALTDNSKSYLLLADILVPAGATTLTGANLADRRVPALPKNVSSHSATLAAKPAASTRPEGFMDFQQDTKQLFRVASGVWEAVAAPILQDIAQATFNAALTASYATLSGSSIVVGVDRNSHIHTPPDVRLYATVAGWYQWYIIHKTSVAGNFGLHTILGTSAGTDLGCHNKTAILTGGNDQVRMGGTISMDPASGLTDALVFQAFHSASATDSFEIGLTRLI